MTWFSILPDHLSYLETWIVKVFLLLGVITIGPWVLLFLYDILLYIFRAVTYEVPVVGGRARGRHRPRAPSLAERPSGRPRIFNISGTKLSGSDSEEPQGLRRRAYDSDGRGGNEPVAE